MDFHAYRHRLAEQQQGAELPFPAEEFTARLARGQMRAFEENMVFHLPICLRIPGHWGIGISDMVTIDTGWIRTI